MRESTSLSHKSIRDLAQLFLSVIIRKKDRVRVVISSHCSFMALNESEIDLQAFVMDLKEVEAGIVGIAIENVPFWMHCFAYRLHSKTSMTPLLAFLYNLASSQISFSRVFFRGNVSLSCTTCCSSSLSQLVENPLWFFMQHLSVCSVLKINCNEFSSKEIKLG